MKCMSCGAVMRVGREDVLYDEIGLPDVLLRDVQVSRCPKCGESEVAIPNLPGLHRTLAELIVSKRGRLNGHEIRFLRKFLGLSGEDFARHIGTNLSTVSRWENGKQPMNKQTDRLLRLMVVHGKRVQKYPLKNLTEVAEDTAQSGRYEVRAGADGWRPAAAA